jgi:hypothetical protein
MQTSVYPDFYSPDCVITVPCDGIHCKRNFKFKDVIVINAPAGRSNQNLWTQGQKNNKESIGKASIIRMRSIDARAIKDTHNSGTTAINATLGYVAGPEDPNGIRSYFSPRKTSSKSGALRIYSGPGVKTRLVLFSGFKMPFLSEIKLNVLVPSPILA